MYIFIFTHDIHNTYIHTYTNTYGVHNRYVLVGICMCVTWTLRLRRTIPMNVSGLRSKFM